MWQDKQWQRVAGSSGALVAVIVVSGFVALAGCEESRTCEIDRRGDGYICHENDSSCSDGPDNSSKFNGQPYLEHSWPSSTSCAKLGYDVSGGGGFYHASGGGAGACGYWGDKSGSCSGGSPSGGGSSALRACKTTNGHICTQLVSGDATAFADQCATDGISVSACPSSYVLGCEGGNATSAGAKVTVSVYWYAAACGAEINKDKSCINGTQVGPGCP
jgi:hypothetical protein